MNTENMALALIRKASRDLNAARKTKCPITRQHKITTANEILHIFLNAAKKAN